MSTTALLPFPLPVSKNTNVNGVTLRAGHFTGYTIVFAGDFLREGESICAKHVFILQHIERRDFLFVSWYSSMNEPVILEPRHYSACFQKDKSTAASNRYLCLLNGSSYLLPYVPRDLFDLWREKHNDADRSFAAGLYGKYLKSYNFDRPRSRLSKKRFLGWSCQTLDSPVDSYRKLFLKCKTNSMSIDISRDPAHLSQEERKRVVQAFALVKTIFRGLIVK
jgi:hypothetical protein